MTYRLRPKPKPRVCRLTAAGTLSIRSETPPGA
jgi:hypothetical protein